MGTVDGCGYDSQQIYTICDACRPCHLIVNILKPVFRQIRCTFELLRCLNLKIWRFCVDHNTTTDYFTTRACAQGNNRQLFMRVCMQTFPPRQCYVVPQGNQPLHCHSWKTLTTLLLCCIFSSVYMCVWPHLPPSVPNSTMSLNNLGVGLLLLLLVYSVSLLNLGVG